MNKVALCGNLGREWEINNSEFGLVAKNVIAVSQNHKKGEEQKTDWIPVVCFSGKADIITQYTKKGDKFLISDGRLNVSSYTDEAGQTRTSFNVVINEFEFLLNPNRSNPMSAQNTTEIPRQNASQQTGQTPPISEQSIPPQPSYSQPQIPADEQGSLFGNSNQNEQINESN